VCSGDEQEQGSIQTSIATVSAEAGSVLLARSTAAEQTTLASTIALRDSRRSDRSCGVRPRCLLVRSRRRPGGCPTPWRCS
jgi:hypothetical protein